MREGFIILTGKKDIFYDSLDRVYRVRMHCPHCTKFSGCRCFDTLEKAEEFIEDGIPFVCSSKCSLMILVDDVGVNDIGDTMKGMGIGNFKIGRKHFITRINRFINHTLKYYISIWRLKWYIFKYFGYISEKDAYKVIDEMDIDFDQVEGESC